MRLDRRIKKFYLNLEIRTLSKMQVKKKKNDGFIKLDSIRVFTTSIVPTRE